MADPGSSSSLPVSVTVPIVKRNSNSSNSSGVVDLSAVKLKKTQTKDTSGPKTAGFVSETEVAAYRSTVLDVNIEEWIEILGPLTFASQFVPITKEIANLLISSYCSFASRPKHSLLLCLPIAFADTLLGLQKVIDSVQQKGDDGVFVKTSSRSAKDSSLADGQLRVLYKKHLAMLLPHSTDAKDRVNNAKVIALLSAATEMLKAHTAEEALMQFVHSERIVQDMQLALSSDVFNSNIVVRRWIPMDVDMEFRGFFNDGKLNALSQYNYVAYFPRLVGMKQQLSDSITAFFYDKVLPVLNKHANPDTGKFCSYVIDFGVTGNNYDEIYVIELNPFLSSTDGALFSWTQERELLRHGPFEFRVCDQPIPNVIGMLGHDWKALLLEDGKM